MKKRPTFSQRVLEKQQKKFVRTLETCAVVAVVLITLGLAGFVVHMERKRLALVKAPSWADFTMQSSGYSYLPGLNPDGVPNSLMINGEQWSVEQVSSFKSPRTLAETYCNEKMIAYIRESDARRLKINLMHEVFHAGDCLHGGDKWWNSEHPTNSVHPGIYHLGEFMSSFLRDNPQFANWEAQ